VEIDGDAWALTIGPTGLHLARKAKRKGIDLTWHDLVSGDAALASALRASLDNLPG